MLIEIAQVLDTAKLENILAMLRKSTFIDGKISAGSAAERVKNNAELKQGTSQSEYMDNLIMGSLAESATFRRAALPFQVAQPVIARYTTGMYYGDHVDDPIMGTGPIKFRSDISVTVFLNNPDDYEGGELIINTSYGEKAVKLEAGSAVLYPSHSVHHIREISKGERLVAVTWIQSMVRNAEQRELLYQLDLARHTLLASKPDANETKQVDRSYVNLLRMWGEV